MMPERKNPYADILALPHHQAENRPHMSMHDRAAQFSPFAALTGFDGVIAETGRMTDRKIELSESQKLLLDQKLTLIDDVIQDGYSLLCCHFAFLVVQLFSGAIGYAQRHIDIHKCNQIWFSQLMFYQLHNDLHSGRHGAYKCFPHVVA